MAGDVSWKFEVDKLNAAIAQRITVRGTAVRTFAQIVNTALYSIALKAQHNTPKASPEKIRSSAFVEVNLIINKMGKQVPGRKGKKYKYFESAHPNQFNALGEHAEEVALMFAVVLARANLSRQGRKTGTSLYNKNTNNAWALDKSVLTSRKVIWDIAERMVSARVSSSAMLRAGWKPALDILRPFIASNDIGGGVGGERFAYRHELERLGTAVPAVDGWVCEGMIENHIGDGGTPLSDRQRDALIKYGTAPFARAIDEEATAMLRKVDEYLEKEARAFNREMG